MKFLALLFVVFATCSASSSSPKLSVPSKYQFLIDQLLREVQPSNGEPKLITANINKYVDDVLKIARLEIVKDGLDPLGVDDINESFSVVSKAYF